VVAAGFCAAVLDHVVEELGDAETRTEYRSWAFTPSPSHRLDPRVDLPGFVAIGREGSCLRRDGCVAGRAWNG
jgi:hypothetical protein